MSDEMGNKFINERHKAANGRLADWMAMRVAEAVRELEPVDAGYLDGHNDAEDLAFVANRGYFALAADCMFWDPIVNIATGIDLHIATGIDLHAREARWLGEALIRFADQEDARGKKEAEEPA